MRKLRLILTIFILALGIVVPSRPIEANPYYQTMAPSMVPGNPVNPNLDDQPYKRFFPVVIKSGSTCHFGIAVVNNAANNVSNYDLSSLGVGNYLDWGFIRSSSVPVNIDYYFILFANNSNFQYSKSHLPSLLAANPGSTWLIGNEPDSEVTYQDHLSAENYADNYFALANIIRQHDSRARIGFGTIIQPTPIRIYYLSKVMDRLAEDAGGIDQAHGLIDVYSIHSFILNEQPGTWGAGVPIGYVAGTWPAPEVIDTSAGESYKTHDINIFSQRVIAFRQWMKNQGEQNKPLWITEYGSLFPSTGNIFLHASDTDTANYMVQTFDFMLGHKDESLGYPEDDFRLVQKWDWFSLNMKLTSFGGSYFNPDNSILTSVGDRFLKYEPSLAAVPVVNPDLYVQNNTLSITPFSPSYIPGMVNYKFSLKFGNKISADRSTSARIDIFDGDTSNPPIYSTQTTIPRCGGTFNATFLMSNQLPGEKHTFTARISPLDSGTVDTNSANNQFTFDPIALPAPGVYPPPSVFFPAVFK